MSNLPDTLSELDSKQYWEGVTQLTYTFLTSLPSYYPSNNPPGSQWSDFQPFLDVHKDAFAELRPQISELIKVSFVEDKDESDGVGTLTLGFCYGHDKDKYTAEAFFPGTTDPKSGDVWIYTQNPQGWDTAAPDTFKWTLLHEIGHALGLQHPVAEPGHVGTDVFTGIENTQQFTVMSYNIHPDGAATTHLALYDIYQLQQKYGANTSTRSENGTTYGDGSVISWGSLTNYCIWDGGGTGDTITAAGMLQSMIDLRQGRFSSITNLGAQFQWFNGTYADNISIAFHSDIENAIGSVYKDFIVGNHLDNNLEGGVGDDYLFGDGAIDDTIDGSPGYLTSRNNATHYTYYIDDSQFGSGQDKLYGGTNNDQLWGGADNDFLYGDDDSDKLWGGEGDDFLYGGSDHDIGGDSDDTLSGGVGDDVLVGGRGADILNGGQSGLQTGLADGLDTADYSTSTSGIKVDLVAGTAQDGLGGTDTLTSIEGFIGSGYADEFKVNEQVAKIDGGADNDTVDYSASTTGLTFDYSGNLSGACTLTSIETLVGTKYSDILTLKDPDESYHGMTIDLGDQLQAPRCGGDLLDLSQTSQSVLVDLRAPDAQFVDFVGSGAERVNLKNVEDVIGSTADDEIYSNNLDCFIHGGLGNDVLHGGTGRQLIFGGDGNDQLHGDNDSVVDILIGGAGADDFYIGANDIVVDLDSDDRVFLNGLQIKGGTNFDGIDGQPGYPLTAQYAIGLQGEAYFTTYIPETPVEDNWISGSLTVVLPGAQGTAYLFGVQASEVMEDRAGPDYDPTTYPGSISIVEHQPEEYYDPDEGTWSAPDYAISAYNALIANGYNWEGMTYGDGSQPIFKVTEAAYQFLLESGYSWNNGVWTGPGVSESAGGDGEWARSEPIQLSSAAHAPSSAALSAYKLDENNASASLGTLSVSDLDGQDGYTFNVSDARFEVVDGQLKLKPGQSLDYESEQSVTVTVTATDSTGLSVQQNFTLTVQDVVEEQYGTAGDDSLTAGLGVDVLYGLEGNDTLDGGAGADTLIGGIGNDLYVVDQSGDVTTENENEGIDTVQAPVTWSLAANIENLTLTGSSSINGTGNELDNILIGNDHANQLSGGDGSDRLDGGAGNDQMSGGLGDDTYVVQAAGDVVTENAGEGVDTIESSVTISALAANVEKLVLTGAAAINGTGNALDNVITGSAAANTLNGGAGADTLLGGAGDDIYVVDNAGDTTTEIASEGTDTVQSAMTWALAANIENLTLTGSLAINGTGNGLDNVLTGNSGANQLSGAAGNDTLNGGTAADTLTGGVGDDTYIVDNTSSSVKNAGRIGAAAFLIELR